MTRFGSIVLWVAIVIIAAMLFTAADDLVISREARLPFILSKGDVYVTNTKDAYIYDGEEWYRVIMQPDGDVKLGRRIET